MTTTEILCELNKIRTVLERLRRMCDGASVPVKRNHGAANQAEIESLHRIIKAAAEEFGLSDPRLIIGHNRTEPVFQARMAAVLLFFEANRCLTLTAIAEAFGRHHTAIVYSLQACRNRIATDATFKARVEKLKGMMQ